MGTNYYKENPEYNPDHPYTLKAVHFSERFSDETNCFDAKLYRGKTFIATVANRGNGGPTDVRFISKEAEAEVIAYCSSISPRGWYNFNDERGEFPDFLDYESLVDDLFSVWIDADSKKKQAASIKRAAKTKLLVVTGDMVPEQAYSYYNKCVYGQMITDNGKESTVQDIIRRRLEAKGDQNIRIFNPETEEWEV